MYKFKWYTDRMTPFTKRVVFPAVLQPGPDAHTHDLVFQRQVCFPPAAGKRGIPEQWTSGVTGPSH